MAVRVSDAVWDGYPGGGSDLLALLALADWADEEGRCFPSMQKIADKMRLSKSQAQRTVHRLIDSGFVRIVGNEFGGPPGATRQYRIVFSALTGRTDATGSANATGRTDAAEGSHQCGETGSTHATQTVSEPSLTVRGGAQALPDQSAESKSRKAGITLQAFIQQCQADSLKPIPEDDPIFDYAEKVGIESEMLAIAWREFKSYWLPTQHRKKDWPGTFRNAVRQNRAGLWYIKEGEPARWTTAGEQARRAAA